MENLIATSPGLFPLPDWAKSELSSLKGHQKSDLITGDEPEEIERIYTEARSEAITEQQNAGLDRVVEAQVRWDDMLAHPLTLNDAVETGGIVRYYDNNNFYRDPQISDELSHSGDVAAELTAATELIKETSLQTVMPGPYTLAQLSSNRFYENEKELLSATASYLASEIAEFPDHETLYLLEPSLVSTPPNDELAPFVSEKLSEVSAASGGDVVIHTYFGALNEKTYAYLMDATVDALGFDIVAGDRDKTLYNVTEYGVTQNVALGVADGQNTLVESPETLYERAEWFCSQVPATEFNDVYISTNTEPFYLPVNKHRQKLAALATATTISGEVEV